MNKRIEALIQEATYIAMPVTVIDGKRTYGDRKQFFDEEKFVELVIKKCISICNQLQDVPASEPRHCAEYIRIYFDTDN